MIKNIHVKVGKNIVLGNNLPLVLIAGPDSIESEKHALFMASKIKKICENLGIPFIFKASYDKANRTSADSFRGVGLNRGLEILSKIRKNLNIAVTTDVHTAGEAKKAGRVVDLIQIPALLSRQTDLLVTAAKTGRAVNIKKGQFIAPHNIDGPIGKVESGGNRSILITERGYMFGYNNVVVDMRGLEIMKQFGYPVIFDASHTVQFPSGSDKISGGDRNLIAPLARAATAVGIAGIFLEVHDNPEKAYVDGPNSLNLGDLKNLLGKLKNIDIILKSVH